MTRQPPARKPGPPASNRCACCGRFVGDTFTGYTHDRMSARGPLYCDRCTARIERAREGKAAR
jgi:hypothetical protein